MLAKDEGLGSEVAGAHASHSDGQWLGLSHSLKRVEIWGGHSALELKEERLPGSALTSSHSSMQASPGKREH